MPMKMDLGTSGLELKPFLAITCLFWLYATVSAVLYTYGLSVSFSELTDEPLFAAWPMRVAQYLILLPPLLGCYWLSLRLGWRPVGRALPLQIGLGVVFALLARPALTVAMMVFGSADEHDYTDLDATLDWIGPELFTAWLASFMDFLVRYGFGLALLNSFAGYKRLRDAELRVTALEQQWGSARLAALRQQLSPHTLFNLLHTIRGQIAWDPPAAQAMVVQLADLLRRLLKAGERDFSSLADELQFVRLYLELQCQRFADRCSFELPDPDAVPEVWVPSLILQPLVENAVTHGLAGHDGPVRVEVTAMVEGDVLRLRITNQTAHDTSGGAEGIGLRNVRERLAVQFGDRARFSAGPQAPHHWVALLELPLLRDAPQSP
jgi:signal transduction histidine kinase